MENKDLTTSVLELYGFAGQPAKTQDGSRIMSKGSFQLLVLENGSIVYANMGFQYPLKNVEALKKLYKEVKREVLKEVAPSFKEGDTPY